MSVWYLDLDDEITDAVARLRAAQDEHVILVIPPGSRIGTGRINFRLLAREATTRKLVVALVSGDAQVRAMATAAGLSAHASVNAAEAALDPAAIAAAAAAAEAGTLVPAAEEPLALGGAARVSTAPGPGGAAAATAARPTGLTARIRGRGRAVASPPQMYAMTPRAASAALTGTGAVSADTGALIDGPARTRVGVTRRRRVAGLGARATAIGGLLIGGAYVAYLVLPNATIVLTPNTTQLGPERVTITASQGVGVPDVEQGLVPAMPIGVPLDATVTWPASGIFVDATAATGVVRFGNANTTAPVFLMQGTKVATERGVVFQTTRDVTVPQANIDTGRAFVDVDVVASKPGPEGNVAADKIHVIVDSKIRDALAKGGSVNNDKATSGGTRTELPRVLKSDYDSATAELDRLLQEQLATRLADPTTAPIGLTIYAATAKLGTIDHRPQRSEVQDLHDPTFDLEASTTASVLAVDEAAVAKIAAEALRLTVDVGTIVYTDSAHADVGTGEVSQGDIVYEVLVSAPAYTPLDPANLKETLKGKTIAEARSILGELGAAEVSVWPDFLSNLPDDVRRIDLTINDPVVPQP